MARVDYWGIEQEIRTVILANADVAATSGIQVLVEEEISMHRTPTVVVTLEGRSAPDDLQTLSAGQRTRLFLDVVILVHFYAMEVSEAARLRDTLIGNVEIALMNNRTLNNLVSNLWLTGGAIVTVGGQAGFNAVGEVRVTVDVTASV